MRLASPPESGRCAMSDQLIPKAFVPEELEEADDTETIECGGKCAEFLSARNGPGKERVKGVKFAYLQCPVRV
jgi:hypothetical protein